MDHIFFSYYYYACNLALCFAPDLIDLLIALICGFKLYSVLLVYWDSDYVM